VVVSEKSNAISESRGYFYLLFFFSQCQWGYHIMMNENRTLTSLENLTADVVDNGELLDTMIELISDVQIVSIIKAYFHRMIQKTLC
jgi:recombinational DNA repair protein RecT